MSLTPLVDSFLIYSPEESRSTTNVALPTVADADRERLGRLFVLADITPEHPDNHDVIRLFQDTVSSAYYSVVDRGLETTFEQALSEVNARLQELLREDKRPWLPGFSSFVGALKDKFFVFSHVGAVQALLMRGNRVIDLTQSAGRDAQPNPLKIFSSVVSGQLEVGDSLLIATSSLFDYFSQEKLRRLIQSANPTEAAITIDRLLRDNPTKTAFAAIVVKLQAQTVTHTSAPDWATTLATPNQTETSMQKLIRREQSTHELLTPSLWRSFTVSLSAYWQRLEDAIRTRLLRRPARRRLSTWKERQGVTSQPSIIVSVLSALGRLLRRIVVTILTLFVAGVSSVVRLVRRPRATVTAPPTSPLVFRSREWLARWRLLPRRQRLVSFGIGLAIVILIPTVIVQSRNQTARQTGTDRATLEQSIRDQTVQLNAMLSYGDEQGAKNVLESIEDTIGQLPNRSGSDKKRIAEFETGLNEAREKLAHRVTPTMTVVADLAPVTSASPLTLVTRGQNRFVVAATGEVIDVTTDNKPTLVGTPSAPMNVVHVVSDDLGLLLVTPDGMARFSPTAKTYTNLTIALPSRLGAVATFQQRFYAVDTGTNQIFRYPRTTGGYGNSVSWLQDDSVSTTNVQSMTVDGSIYLLNQDGSIIELVSGSRVEFNLEAIDPTLNSVVSVWTTPTSDALYVFSPQSKRLVVFNKNGRLQTQYTGDSFGDAVGFTVDEAGKKVYLARSNGQVESFSLED